jgi:hypothetical protein
LHGGLSTIVEGASTLIVVSSSSGLVTSRVAINSLDNSSVDSYFSADGADFNNGLSVIKRRHFASVTLPLAGRNDDFLSLKRVSPDFIEASNGTVGR